MTTRDRLIIGVVTVFGAVAVAAICVAIGVSMLLAIVFGVAFGVLVVAQTPRLRRRQP
jgi:hypothetical protein